MCRKHVVVQAAKELHFNRNMEALKRMQAGADKLATVVGVTIGPKVKPCPCLMDCNNPSAQLGYQILTNLSA
jgi:hypothetical protein